TTKNDTSDSNQKTPTPRAEQQVIAVCGSPGAGKTTVARAIASRLGVLLLTRDEITTGLRQSAAVAMQGRTPYLHSTQVRRPSLHHSYRDQAEAIMIDLGQRLAAGGVRFVLETSLVPKELAVTVGLWVHVVARPEVIDARLQARPDRRLADQLRRGEMPATIFAPPAGVDAVEIDTSDTANPDLEPVMTRLGPGPRRTS
ncbi:MAG TPA: AAA family ATPase, partial [Kutzneria sp.]|nr:AAA family ATPase [Kutzneria sp.]